MANESEESAPLLRVNKTHFKCDFKNPNQMLPLSQLGLKPGCGKSWVELLRGPDLGKGFVDLDVKPENDPALEGPGTEPPAGYEDLKKKYKIEGRNWCEEQFGVEVSDIAICDASGYDTEKKCWKVSFHYAVNGVSIRWIDHLQLPGIKENKPDWLDDSIYKSAGGRAMRMVHCVKAYQIGDRFAYQKNRPLVPLTHKREDQLHCHVIQCLTDEEKANRIEVENPVTIDPEQIGSRHLTEQEKMILELCDPNCDRHQWISIGMALKNEGCPYAVWRDWSAGSEEKFEEAQCRRQWDSFTSNGGLKMGTVFYYAQLDNPHAYRIARQDVYTEKWNSGNGQNERALVEYMNTEICYMQAMGKDPVYLMFKEHTAVDKDGIATEEEYAKTIKGATEEYKPYNVMVEDNRGRLKSKNVYDIFRESKYRRVHRSINFYPKVGYKFRNNDFNSFRGLAIPPEAAVEPEGDDLKPLLDHIFNIWCRGNQEDYEYVLNWMAHVVQKPHIKTTVSICIHSKFEGAGKNIVIDFLKMIIGDKHAVSVSKMDQGAGKFNSLLSAKLLVEFCEALWGGDKGAKSTIKDQIDGKTINIERKGIDITMEASFHNWLFTSNEDWCIPADDGSRRYFALDCDNKWAGVQDCPEKTEYFKAIAAVSAHKFAWFLYHRDISAFNPKKFRITELLRDQAQRSRDPTTQWFAEMLKAGQFEGENGIESLQFGFNDSLPVGLLCEMRNKRMVGGHVKTESLDTFIKKFKDLVQKTGGELQDEGRKTRHGKKHTMKRITTPYRTMVDTWNRTRADNIEYADEEALQLEREQDQARADERSLRYESAANDLDYVADPIPETLEPEPEPVV